jgi:hypothetical protein
MRLLEEDKQMFETLSKSELGNQLVSYLLRLSNSVCDVRTMDEGDTPETMKRVAMVIEKDLIQRIHARVPESVVLNECI